MIASGRVLTITLALIAAVTIFATVGIGALVRFVARLITS